MFPFNIVTRYDTDKKNNDIREDKMASLLVEDKLSCRIKNQSYML
jgi:hypothetical protein